MQKMSDEEKKYLEHRKTQILVQFSRGVSVQSLCDLFDLSEEEVNEVIKKSIKRKTKKRIDFRKESLGKLNGILSRITTLGKKGKNARQISDILNIALYDIRNIMKEFNVKTYVHCKDCGELTDRTKRDRRDRCDKCGQQKKTDYNIRWTRTKYRTDQKFREKMKKNNREHGRIKRLLNKSLKNPV